MISFGLIYAQEGQDSLDLDRNCKLGFFKILSRLTAKFSCSNPGQFLKGILWIYPLGLPVGGTDTETWPWEGFSLQAGRFLQHMGIQCDFLWASLHVRLALWSLDSSRVLEPWEGFFLQLKDLPALERDSVTLQVQGQGSKIHSAVRRFSYNPSPPQDVALLVPDQGTRLIWN